MGRSEGRLFHFHTEAGMSSWEFLKFTDILESKNLTESKSDVELGKVVSGSLLYEV